MPLRRLLILTAAGLLLTPGLAAAGVSAGTPFPTNLLTTPDATQITGLRVDQPDDGARGSPGTGPDRDVLRLERHAHDRPGRSRAGVRDSDLGTAPRDAMSPWGTRRLASPRSYSHSIVAGGFEERSRATRLTPGTSLTIRLEIVSSSS